MTGHVVVPLGGPDPDVPCDGCGRQFLAGEVMYEHALWVTRGTQVFRVMWLCNDCEARRLELRRRG
jgi:hypothetical protein